ncbi:MAG: hypothetical protein DRJ61_15930 [Acidobacteria bacterium]|nr:MAG: hypothetical protein DRJ61_15930 [Acidobacteriota bacterium]
MIVGSSRFDRLNLWLVGGLVVIPPLAVFFGSGGEGPSFVLYREPKLVAMAVLGWLFLSTFFVSKTPSIDRGDFLAVLRCPEILILGAFVGYMALTGVWGRVYENFLYEINQWSLLFVLLVTLLVWDRSLSSLSARVEDFLLASLAIVSGISIIQLVIPIPFLSPVWPSSGILHTSTMGYKNPFALAILGQLFLLTGRCLGSRRTTFLRIACGVCAVGELVLLLSLGSRSSVSGLLVATVVLVVLWSVALLRTGSYRRFLLAVLVGLAVVSGIVTVGGWFQQSRVNSMMEIAASPGTYLGTDRGIYLLNTLEMVQEHPLGVGAGDWQTFYPIFRRHSPGVAFSLETQVRRAHSDPVQILGELGWPGLILWALFLGTVGTKLLRSFFADPNTTSAFHIAQMTALVVAGLTDYLLETPYNKFQFVLVLFLVMAPLSREDSCRGGSPHLGIPKLMGLVVLLAAVSNVTYSISLGMKIQVSGQIRAFAQQRDIGVLIANRRRFINELDRRFSNLPGHIKTFYKDHLVLGDQELRMGNLERARHNIEIALELHPYNPNAYLLQAEAATSPAQAERCRIVAREILEGSVSDR